MQLQEHSARGVCALESSSSSKLSYYMYDSYGYLYSNTGNTGESTHIAYCLLSTVYTEPFLMVTSVT